MKLSKMKLIIFLVSLFLANNGLAQMEVKMFFNHSCPCSHRLMADIVKSIEKHKKDISVEFYNVAPTDEKGLQFLNERWKLPNKLKVDADKSYAKSLGIVATPEMIISNKGKRIYKGPIIQENYEDFSKNKDMLDLVVTNVVAGKADFPAELQVEGCPLDENNLIFPEE